jgi:hypothetical protein
MEFLPYQDHLARHGHCRVEVAEINRASHDALGLGLGRPHQLKAIRSDVRGEHLRAFRQERLSDAAPYPLRRSRHEHVLVCESPHHGTAG